MIHIENTWLQKKVVPNLNVQILYMDQPFYPEGLDAKLVKEWLSEDNETKESNNTLEIKIISTKPYVILECSDPSAKIYCFFDYSIRGIEYKESQEFTDLYNSAHMVLAYSYGPKGVSKTVKLK